MGQFDFIPANAYGAAKQIADGVLLPRSEAPLLTADMFTYTDVVFHHLPDFYAPSALAAMLVHAIGLGLILNDLLSNTAFDRRLVLSPGWSNPLKALNRLAYFILRIGTALDLILVLVFSNVAGLACTPFFRGIKSAWYISIVCIDFIFVTRTLALYGWPKKLYIPIGLLTLTYVCLGVYNTWVWGYPVQIPNTQFCAYISQKPSEEPIRTIFPVYYGFAIATDTIILILTCLRLASKTDQRILNQSMDSNSQQTMFKRLPSLSNTLLVQGFILYGSLQGTRLSIILIFYLSDYRQSWTLLVLGLALTIKSLTASALVRQTSNVARRRQSHFSSMNMVNSGIYSGGLPPLSPMSPTSPCASCNVRRMIDRAQNDLDRRRARPDLTVHVEESMQTFREALMEEGASRNCLGLESASPSSMFKEGKCEDRLCPRPVTLLYADTQSPTSVRPSASIDDGGDGRR